MRSRLGGLVLLLVLAGATCRDDRDDLTGVWVGSFVQVLQGRAGTIRLELSQSGSSLGGAWEIELPDDLSFRGRLEGTVAGASVDARLLPDDAEICPYRWTATARGDRLEGPYEAFDCAVEIVGRIETRRQ